MLTQTLLSFPLFFLGLFGLIQLSELAYLQTAVDLASFQAVRSDYVDAEKRNWGKIAAARLFQSASHPLSNHSTRLKVDVESTSESETWKVNLSGKTIFPLPLFLHDDLPEIFSETPLPVGGPP